MLDEAHGIKPSQLSLLAAGAEVSPQLLEFWGAEHAVPGGHATAALEHRSAKALRVVERKLPEVISGAAGQNHVGPVARLAASTVDNSPSGGRIPRR